MRTPSLTATGFMRRLLANQPVTHLLPTCNLQLSTCDCFTCKPAGNPPPVPSESIRALPDLPPISPASARSELANSVIAPRLSRPKPLLEAADVSAPCPHASPAAAAANIQSASTLLQCH